MSKDSHQPQPAENAATPNGLAGRIGALLRGWLSHPLQLVTVAAGLIAAGGGVAVIWLVAQPRPAPRELSKMEAALLALDARDLDTAKAWAEAMLSEPNCPRTQQAQAAFVLGAAAVYEAEAVSPRKRRALYLAAARHLEDARAIGLPEGRQAEGNLLLAQALVGTGQWAQARPSLLSALELNPQRKAELHRWLCQSYLSDATPDLIEALRHNQAWLAAGPLTEEEQLAAHLQKAEILLRQGKLDESEAVLRAIAPREIDAAAVLLLQGRVLMARAMEHRGEVGAERPGGAAPGHEGGGPTASVDAAKRKTLLQEAAKTFQAAAGRDLLSGETAAAAMYLTGECFRALGDDRAAAAQYARTSRLHPETEEAWAADFRRMLLLWRENNDSEAMAILDRLGKAGAAEGFRNRWIAPAEIAEALIARFERFLASTDQAQAVELARHAAPLLGSGKAGRLEAETLAAWGRRLAAEAENERRPDAAEQKRIEAREKLREAGRAYERLAELEITSREYTDYLFAATEAYYLGRDYSGAARMARLYLRNEVRRRHPQTLVMLGDSLLALGKAEAAAKALDECIEFFPRDPAVHRARLLAARAGVEKNRPKQAEQYLYDNLSSKGLTPESIEWRESLFALGMLAHQTGDGEQAIARLQEALARYPNAPEAVAARYALADVLARRARAALAAAEQSADSGARLVLPKAVRDDLQAALALYRRVQSDLQSRNEIGTLTPADRAMLRNAIFAIGGALADLGDYEAAARTFAGAGIRYQHHPVALNAYVQLIALYRRLGRPLDAKQAVAQARQVLERISGDEGFVSATPFSRSQWTEVLDDLERL